MRCSSCGRDNRPDAAFCDACGTGLERACECGRSLQPDARFCDSCGRRVGGAPGAADGQAIAEGERRTATVLFVDMVGSTSIGERLDEEDMYVVVQRGLERMQEAVFRHGGGVHQFRGDGIMALFGAPIAQEDAARRAVAAALEMQHALRMLAAETEKRYGIAPIYPSASTPAPWSSDA